MPVSDQRLQQAQELDEASLILVKAGVNAVKRHPGMTGMYLVGICLFIFASGTALTVQQREAFEREHAKVDYYAVDEARFELQDAERQYYHAKGWFSCDGWCQRKKGELDVAQDKFNRVMAEKERKIANAKGKVGVYSEIGVAETRDLFWTRFGQGKQFAKRQTMWDALFMGISSMGRDENLVGYLVRILVNMIFNFTMGMIGAVIGFMWTLYSVIQSYQESLFSAMLFFALASLAAISFAATFLLGLYTVTAGTVYVGAKMMAQNLRIEGGSGGQYQQQPGYIRAGPRPHHD